MEKKISETQKKAARKYRQRSCKDITVTCYLNNENDLRVYEHYKKQPEKNKYIKKLIEKDIEGNVE